MRIFWFIIIFYLIFARLSLGTSNGILFKFAISFLFKVIKLNIHDSSYSKDTEILRKCRIYLNKIRIKNSEIK